MPVNDAVFTRAGVHRGFVAGFALAPGVLAYGIVFGVLAAASPLSALEALLTSALLFSSTAQLAMLQGWGASTDVVALVLVVLVVNARYVLYGAALRPWLGALRARYTYPSLYFLGDGAWALALARHREGERDGGFVLGSGAACFAPWLVGTLAGYFGGALLGDPRRLGLDMMIVTFAAAIAAMVWRGRAEIGPALAAAAAAVAAHFALPPGWTIVSAAIAGVMVAAWLAEPDEPDTDDAAKPA